MTPAGALGGAVLALLLLASLMASPPAVGSNEAGSNIRRTPGESAAFTLPGSNGYSLYFKSENGMLTIVASRRRPSVPTISPTGELLPRRVGASSESTYVVSGVSRDPWVIDADLGPAGRVSLAFQPSGEKKVTSVDLESKSEKCFGAVKVTRHLGSFVGSVSFRGENGYTTAEATSVRGTVGTSPFRNCTTVRRRPAEAPEARGEAAAFTVSGTGSFFAFREAGTARFFAMEGEELGPELLVLRSATATARPSRFSLGPDGLWARLRPPAPFAGMATYRDPPGAPPSWAGDLKVTFPGLVRPLTGDGMSRPDLRIFGGSGS
jgi:hypothetical protein